MAFTQSDWIQVKRTPGKGWGVFARRQIPAGAVIERVPVLVVPVDDICDSDLAEYCFTWGRETVALALGYGSIYNHSYYPNAQYQDKGLRAKQFVALRHISAGEEITINYNGHPADGASVGFEVC